MQTTAEIRELWTDEPVHYLDICSKRRGIIHRAELLETGLSKDAIYRLLRRGELIHELPAVYRARGAPRTWLQIVTAVSVWAGNSSAITGHAGAAVYGLDSFREQGRIDVVTTRYRRSPRADVQLHRVRDLAADDVRTWRGIEIAQPARLLLDLARSITPDRLEKALEDILRRRLTTAEELIERIERFPAGTPGLAACNEVLSRRTKDDAAAESDLETECLQDLRRGGAPAPRRQHWIRDDRGPIGRIDLAYPHARLGIEVDSYRWHGTFRSFHSDRERYNSAVAAGWRLLLYTKRTNKNRFARQVLQILNEGQEQLLPASS